MQPTQPCKHLCMLLPEMGWQWLFRSSWGKEQVYLPSMRMATPQLWPVLPIRMWLTAWLSFWPPWCLSRQIAHWHPWHSMPLTVIPTPQKQLALKPCLSWGMNPAPTAVSTALVGSRSTCSPTWTSSTTQTLRPTEWPSCSSRAVLTLTPNRAFSGKKHFSYHTQIQPEERSHSERIEETWWH